MLLQSGVHKDDANRSVRAAGAVPSPLRQLQHGVLDLHVQLPRQMQPDQGGPVQPHLFKQRLPVQSRIRAGHYAVRRLLSRERLRVFGVEPYTNSDLWRHATVVALLSAMRMCRRFLSREQVSARAAHSWCVHTQACL